MAKPVTACFVAVWGAEFGRGAWAEMERLLLMQTPMDVWDFMILKATCVQQDAVQVGVHHIGLLLHGEVLPAGAGAIMWARGRGGVAQSRMLDRASNHERPETREGLPGVAQLLPYIPTSQRKVRNTVCLGPPKCTSHRGIGLAT